MRISQRLLGGSVAMVLALASVAACSSDGEVSGSSAVPETTAESESGDADQAITMAYSVEALDETQTDIANAIRVRAHQLTEEGTPVTVDIFGADNSVDRQNNDIEAIVSRGTDALIVTTVDPAGSVSALEAAHAAGVKVIDVRGNIPSDSMDVIYVGLDEPKMGELLKEQARKYLDENPDAVLRFGLIKGGATFTTTHIRVESVKELAKELPDRVQILAEDYGDWTTEKATSLMEDWSVRYPDMNAIASSSDEMSLGVVNVLRTRGSLDKFFIVSVNGSNNGIQMVRDGDIYATIGIDFGEYGRGMVDAAMGSVNGEIAPGGTFDYSDKVNVVVDASNVEAFAAKKQTDADAAANLK